MKFDADTNVGSGNGMFVKLNDGESVVGILRGNIVTDVVKYVNGKPVVCGPKEEEAKFRFRVNMIIKDPASTELKVKMLSQGAKLYKDLKALSEAGYDLSKTMIKISRSGKTATDTKYTVVPMPNGVITPEVDAELSKLELLEIN